MWQKIVNRLEQGKRYIIELIDQSTAAYDQREELCNKIQSLREKGISESGVHMQEMRELQRKLDHDAKLQQFFGIKGHRRQNADLEIREAQKKQQLQEHFQRQIDDYQKLLDNMMVNFIIIKIIKGIMKVSAYSNVFILRIYFHRAIVTVECC